MGRERIGTATGKHAAETIDGFLSECGVEPDDIGIVLGPTITGDEAAIVCNVRTVEGQYRGQIEYDVAYRFDETDHVAFVNEIYPAWIDVFESYFSEADLQYWTDKNGENQY